MTPAPATVLRLASLLAPLALGAACSKKEEAPPPAPIPSSDYAHEKFVPAETEGREPPKVTFTDVTKESGLDFVHVSGAHGRKYLPETMGSGVVIADFDGDGRLDVYCVQGEEWPDQKPEGPAPTGKLFRNLGGMKFEDVTAGSGLDVSFLGMGASAADYDGDGDEDLFVTSLGENHLFRNDGAQAGGRPHFTDVTAAAKLETSTWTDKQGQVQKAWSTSAAWLDYDGDGILDLFVCHYVHWSTANDVFTSLNGRDKAYTQPTKYEADSCHLYRGRADGTFEDVTKAAGVWTDNAKSLGVALGDLNGDGRPDIAVANDTEANYLFESRPDGRYVDIAPDAGVAKDGNGLARSGMGISMAPLANDGRYTVSIGNFSGQPISMYTMIKNSEAFFVDQAGSMRVGPATDPSLTFAVLFCDYDLDGMLDVVACNGHIEPEIEAIKSGTKYEEPTQLFWNRGDCTFADVSRASGALNQPLVARGAAAGDLDGDGDLDLVIMQNGRPARLYRNDQETGHGWLRVRLQGSGRNRDALGASVTLETASGRRLTRAVDTGSSYLSQCDVAPTFGLGDDAKAPVSVEVRWPSGAKERFEGLEPGREHRLVEGQGKPAAK